MKIQLYILRATAQLFEFIRSEALTMSKLIIPSTVNFLNTYKRTMESPVRKKIYTPIATLAKLNYATKNEATFDVRPCKLHKLNTGPKTSTSLTAKDSLKLYQELIMIRRLEHASAKLYRAKFIVGFCHLYTGQEAVAVGMRAALRDVDCVITSYRCHGWSYLMGVSPASMLCELTGRKTGSCRGKGGSMHLYARNFYGGNGIVGGQVPLGLGIAFAQKYRGDGGVTFALYGDGAANQGQLFESYNMAQLWKIPCVFVCENNGYGMGTSAERSSASVNYYTRGDYVSGINVDGMDVLASREATRFAIEHCTSGKGPLVMEMETYRYTGHSMSDPGTSYRTREEVQEIRAKRDPIAIFKEKIVNKELVTADQLKEIDNQVRKEVNEATKKAEEDPGPDPEELGSDVYYKNLSNPMRGVYPNGPIQHTEVYARKM